VQRAADWFGEALAELRASRDLCATGHWSWCCFTSQQAAEKALKAICEHFRSPQFGHNLNVLIDAVEQHVRVDNSIRTACARLNRYYIPTRYPDAFPQGVPAEQYFESDAHQALDDAEQIVRFAERAIQSS